MVDIVGVAGRGFDCCTAGRFSPNAPAEPRCQRQRRMRSTPQPLLSSPSPCPPAAFVASAVGALTAGGVYLILRLRAFPVILGLALLSYAVNVFLFASGRLGYVSFGSDIAGYRGDDLRDPELLVREVAAESLQALEED